MQVVASTHQTKIKLGDITSTNIINDPKHAEMKSEITCQNRHLEGTSKQKVELKTKHTYNMKNHI